MNVREMTVGKLVEGRDVYFVLESDTVLHAVEYMTEREVGAVPVLDKSYEPDVLADTVGMFSERDVMTRVVAKRLDPGETLVGKAMTKKVAVVGEDATAAQALALMRQLHVRHLPVLVGKRLLGCISMRNLLEATAATKKAEINLLDDYIEKMEEASWWWLKDDEKEKGKA